jgi:hypothetical protein
VLSDAQRFKVVNGTFPLIKRGWKNPQLEVSGFQEPADFSKGGIFVSTMSYASQEAQWPVAGRFRWDFDGLPSGYLT